MCGNIYKTFFFLFILIEFDPMTYVLTIATVKPLKKQKLVVTFFRISLVSAKKLFL